MGRGGAGGTAFFFKLNLGYFQVLWIWKRRTVLAVNPTPPWQTAGCFHGSERDSDLWVGGGRGAGVEPLLQRETWAVNAA